MSNIAALSPQELAQVLQYLNWSAHAYPDVPQHFVPPYLTDPSYVPPYRGTGVIVCGAVTIAVAALVVVARLLARRFRSPGRFGLDDWFIIPALIATGGFTAIQLAAVKYGCVGYHSYDCTIPELQQSFLYKYSGLVLYSVSAMLTKISITLFCLRLAPATAVIHRLVVKGTLYLVAITFAISIWFTLTICTPVKAAWDLPYLVSEGGKCLPEWKVVISWATIYAATDLWLVVLPIWIVLGLSMKKRTRVGTAVIFAMGLAATAFSILKITVVKSAYDSFDGPWNFTKVLIYSQLEITLGIICASLPALSFLLVSLAPAWFNQSSNKEASKSTSYPTTDSSALKSSATRSSAPKPLPSSTNMSRSSSFLQRRLSHLDAYAGEGDPLERARSARPPLRPIYPARQPARRPPRTNLSPATRRNLAAARRRSQFQGQFQNQFQGIRVMDRWSVVSERVEPEHPYFEAPPSIPEHSPVDYSPSPNFSPVPDRSSDFHQDLERFGFQRDMRRPRWKEDSTEDDESSIEFVIQGPGLSEVASTTS